MEKRLDVFLKDNNFFITRQQAKTAIESGQVLVNGKIIRQPAFKVEEGVKIEIIAREQYVSRGAYKLIGAIKAFNLDVTNKVCLDIGSSTGGFTDVLLKNGAKKVYCVDVGKNQLHPSIKNDARVVAFEQTDFRTLAASQVADAEVVVMDVSFISHTLLIEHIKHIFANKNITIVALLKPQFECGQELARKYKGIIKNKAVHMRVVAEVVQYWQQAGFVVEHIISSPIKGGDGNTEYLLKISQSGTNISDNLIKNTVDAAFKKAN